MAASKSSLNANLLHQLECPVCIDVCTPPIYMCVNGHHVCNTCQLKLDDCSVCRAPGTPKIRNRGLEEVSKLLEMPCRNAKHGCPEVFNLDEMERHLPNCRSRVYSCLINCDWKGTSEQLLSHVRSKHPSYCHTDGESVTHDLSYDGIDNIACTLLATYAGKVFWIVDHYNSDISTMYIYARYVGPVEEAGDYKCEFRFSTDDEAFNATFCKRVIDLGADYQDPKNTFQLDKNMIKLLIAEAGIIQFSVKIGDA